MKENLTKQEKQYRLWIYKAIVLARRAVSGKVLAAEVADFRDKFLYFSYEQWALASGWLHAAQAYVYEGAKAKGLTDHEIYNELFGLED